MKLNYIIGASAVLLTGVMAAWGVSEYVVLKSQLNEVQKEVQPTSLSTTPSPSPQMGNPASTVSPTPSPSPAPSAEPNFDTLPLCDQLDSIAKSGKAISEFIAKSGRYEELATQVITKCNWHAEQLKQADRILHPPPPVVNEPPAASLSASEPERAPWNNCNGIQEPGESASEDCAARKKQSDLTGTITPGDNRPDHRRGNRPHGDDDYYYDPSYDPSNDNFSTDDKNQQDDQESEPDSSSSVSW